MAICLLNGARCMNFNVSGIALHLLPTILQIAIRRTNLIHVSPPPTPRATQLKETTYMVQPQLPSDSNNIQRTAVVALARDCALGCCDFAADEACL
eukprot:528721-Rhodomonas_salina.1